MIKQVITKDNSITFFSEKYQETYHSISGAIEESFEKFIKPCKDKVNPNILNICFGIGYNSAAAIDFFKECTITALEIDKNIINEIENINAQFNSYPEIKEVAKTFKSKHITLIMGDARETIKSLKDNSYDIIILDPFSPKKCPELWTEEFIKEIYKKTKKDGILTTFSCASQVRKNLIAAGFKVKDGPRVRRRSPSTIAIKA